MKNKLLFLFLSIATLSSALTAMDDPYRYFQTGPTQYRELQGQFEYYNALSNNWITITSEDTWFMNNQNWLRIRELDGQVYELNLSQLGVRQIIHSNAINNIQLVIHPLPPQEPMNIDSELQKEAPKTLTKQELFDIISEFLRNVSCNSKLPELNDRNLRELYSKYPKTKSVMAEYCSKRPSITKFEVRNQNSDDSAHTLTSWPDYLCQETCSITEFGIMYCKIHKDTDFSSFWQKLSKNKSLTKLSILQSWGNKEGERFPEKYDDRMAYAIAELIKRDTPLKEIDLRGNHITDIGAGALAGALYSNDNINDLYLEGCEDIIYGRSLLEMAASVVNLKRQQQHKPPLIVHLGKMPEKEKNRNRKSMGLTRMLSSSKKPDSSSPLQSPRSGKIDSPKKKKKDKKDK